MYASFKQAPSWDYFILYASKKKLHFLFFAPFLYRQRRDLPRLSRAPGEQFLTSSIIFSKYIGRKRVHAIPSVPMIGNSSGLHALPAGKRFELNPAAVIIATLEIAVLVTLRVSLMVESPCREDRNLNSLSRGDGKLQRLHL